MEYDHEIVKDWWNRILSGKFSLAEVAPELRPQIVAYACTALICKSAVAAREAGKRLEFELKEGVAGE